MKISMNIPYHFLKPVEDLLFEKAQNEAGYDWRNVYEEFRKGQSKAVQGPIQRKAPRSPGKKPANPSVREA